MMKVLILDCGDAPYSLTCARSLGSEGHEVHFGFSYGSRIFDAYSKYCKAYLFYPDPLYAQEDFLSFFEKLSGKYDFILPMMEKTQLPLSIIKNILEEKGTSVPIPPFEILNKSVNKAEMFNFCSINKIDIPRTVILINPPKIEEIIEKVGIPFIMKSSTEINVPPGPENRYFVFENKPSQRNILKVFRRLRKYGPVILQQKVEGSGVSASFIFSRYHKIIAYFGHRRLLEFFPTGGPSVIAETYFHQDALKKGAKLLKSLKWQGVAMVEFKLGYDGRLYFMEVNPRFWGTLPLAIASNVNFPKLLVEYYNSSKEEFSSKLAYKEKVFVRISSIPYLFIESIRTKNFNFTTKIVNTSFKIFKHGFPFIEEFERLDLVPKIARLINTFRSSLYKGKPSKIDKILFGPVTSYEKLVRFGVKSIIDLRESTEKGNIKIPRGIRYYNFPIKDDSAPDVNFLLSISNVIRKLNEKGPIYIHCRLGRGRAPMVVIAYLISKKTHLGTAYLKVYSARPYSYLNLVQKKVIYEFYKMVSKNFLHEKNNFH